MLLIRVRTKHNGEQETYLERTPDLCPVCRLHCDPKFEIAYATTSRHRIVQAVFRCTNSACESLFVAIYGSRGSHVSQGPLRLLESMLVLHTVPREFSELISDLSPDFCAIYAEAEVAEANRLLRICGVGYRKALEFLIKDYLIKNRYKDDEGKQQAVIATKQLGACINNFLGDVPNIQTVAKRAVWLGNDETHYVREYTHMDLEDLKSLIQISVKWIDLVLETQKYERALPDKA